MKFLINKHSKAIHTIPFAQDCDKKYHVGPNDLEVSGTDILEYPTDNLCPECFPHGNESLVDLLVPERLAESVPASDEVNDVPGPTYTVEPTRLEEPNAPTR